MMFRLVSLIASCVIAFSAAAESPSISFFRGRGQVTSSGATVIASRSQRYFGISANPYFDSAWDLYEHANERTHLVRSGIGWLLGVMNDGSTLEYTEIETGQYNEVGRLMCTLSRVTTTGAATTILSFAWPPMLDPELNDELFLSNDSSCPTISLSHESGSQQFLSLPPLYLTGWIGGHHRVRPLTQQKLYRLDTSPGGVLSLVHEVSSDEIRSLPRSNSDEPESQFILDDSGYALAILKTSAASHATLLFEGSVSDTFVLNKPNVLVGISSVGLPLVKRGRDLFARTAEGSLEPMGRYIPAHVRPLAIYNNYEGTGFFSEFDSFNGQYFILLRGKRGLSADANCHVPTAFGWRINSVLGMLGSRTAVVRMNRGRAARLALVDVVSLQRGPLTCQASIKVEVLGPAACRSRVYQAPYGERLQSAEYETLPDHMRCGFKVTLYSPSGTKVSGATVEFRGSYSNSSNHGNPPSANQATTTDSNGDALFWVDITRPDKEGGSMELGPSFIVAPTGSTRWHERGVLVYDRYSHV